MGLCNAVITSGLKGSNTNVTLPCQTAKM